MKYSLALVLVLLAGCAVAEPCVDDDDDSAEVLGVPEGIVYGYDCDGDTGAVVCDGADRIGAVANEGDVVVSCRWDCVPLGNGAVGWAVVQWTLYQGEFCWTTTSEASATDWDCGE